MNAQSEASAVALDLHDTYEEEQLESENRSKCVGTCTLLQLGSLGLLLFLTGWQESIDDDEVRERMPGLFWSSTMLKYVLLASASKDIAVQLTVWRMVDRDIWQRSLAYHFVGWAFFLPFLGACTTWTIVCLIANKGILETQEVNLQEACQSWYRVSLNFLFYALIYKLVHVFPLSCIYLEFQGHLIDDDGMDADSSVEGRRTLAERKAAAAKAICHLASYQCATSFDSK